MLTLRKFRARAESYGADLGRWPEALRNEAQNLLARSAEARAVMAEARAFDAALNAARAREDAALWPRGEQEAALGRLRAGVSARIAAAPPRRAFRLGAWLPWRGGYRPSGLSLRGVGIATSGGFAVMAGLLIGAMSGAPPTSDALLTALLQPVPIHLLAD